jgi:predicted metal-binding membrane protein
MSRRYGQPGGGAGATPWLSAEVQGVAVLRTSKGVIGMQAVADRRYVLLLMGGLIALAWLTLWLWGQSPYGRLLNHDELSRADLGNGLVVLVMVVGWTLMIVAMMRLMFAVGVGNFGWMLILGALMAIEKNLPWGRRISAPLGVVLLCWGLALGLEAVLA